MTTTNSAGVYAFPVVQPGTYDISVSKQGFSAADELGVNVVVNQIGTFDITLKTRLGFGDRESPSDLERSGNYQRGARRGNRQSAGERPAAERPEFHAAPEPDPWRQLGERFAELSHQRRCVVQSRSDRSHIRRSTGNPIAAIFFFWTG